MRQISLNKFAPFVVLAICVIAASPAVQAQTTPTAGKLLITEFRLRGPNGATDEFIEIFNNTGGNHIVTAASGTGYAIVASDGVARCVLPNGMFLLKDEHVLCVNSNGYSLNEYPAGSFFTGVATALGDFTYTMDIPDNAGLAIFNNNSGGASYSIANRIDAVGSTAEANTLYKEGTGYPALNPLSLEHSFVRDECGKGGSITTPGICTSGGLHVDTDNNATNFFYVSPSGISAGAGQRMGAPGPQNRVSPKQLNAQYPAFLVDRNVAGASPPNRVRDFTPNPANNSTFGTLSIRRRYVNNTGTFSSYLRVRIIDLTTYPAPAGVADLRAISSVNVVASGITDAGACAAKGTPTTPPCSITIEGTILEQPPSQPNGGGFNSSLAAVIPLGRFIGNGESINLQFLFGVQQPGAFKLYINVEANTFVPVP
jgi:hypothetical protein